MNTAKNAKLVGRETPIRPLDEWAEIVQGDLNRAVEGILAAGRHLLEAKGQHKGTFKAWAQSGAAGVGYTQATRLMKIAERLDGLKGCTPCNLPGDTLVLYGLVVHLNRRQIEEAIAAGDVHPGLNRGGLEALLARKYKVDQGAVPELLELVQQTWTPKKGYFPKPPRSSGTRLRGLPAPVRMKPAPRRWVANLVGLGKLNETALDSDDPQIAFSELLKLGAAVDAELTKRAAAMGITRMRKKRSGAG